MPVYNVTTPTGEHIVDATNQSVALNHVVRNTIAVKNMTASELAKAIKDGREIEYAGAADAKPTDPNLPATNRVRINQGPWLDADSDEGKEAVAQAHKELKKAADKGESVMISINDGPELALGSAEANEALEKIKA